MNDDNEPVIRVKDRRMFNSDGSLRTPDFDEDDERREERAPEPPKVVAEEAKRPEPAAEPERAPEPPREEAPADREPKRPPQPSLFSDFVVNLASQAAMYMGLVDNPLGPQFPTDLGAARQMIDILGMLQEKTRGNLTSEENVLLERILSDLRMQFVSMASPRR